MKLKHLIILSIILIWIMLPVIALAEEEPVTIKYWTDPRFQDMIGKEDVTQNPGDYEKLLAREFEEKYPHVNIEINAIAWEDLETKVVTSIKAGNPPDILKDYMGRTAYYAYQGLLEPIDEYLSEEFLSDYYESYLNMYTIQGHLHALPAHAWAGTLLINKQVWKDANKEDLLPDDYNWTFTEFEEALRAVANSEEEMWPLAFRVLGDGQSDYEYLSYFYGMGGKVYSDDYKSLVINSEENIKALKFLKKLHDEEIMNPGFSNISGESFRNMFFSKDTAVVPGQLWWYNLKDTAEDQGRLEKPFDMEVINFPHAPGVNNGLTLGPTGFAVFKQEDEYKREWVMKFVQWLNSKEKIEEYILNSQQFPARKSVEIPFKDDEAYMATQKLISERGYVDMGLLCPAYSELRTTYAPIIQRIIMGDISAEEGLEEIETKGNRILDKSWNRLSDNIWEQ